MNSASSTFRSFALTFTAALLLATSAGSALAESPTVVSEPFVGHRTRAEVVAELAAFKQARINPWGSSYDPLRQFRSHTTREAVTAAFLSARGEVAAIHGEDSGSARLAQARAQSAPSQLLAGEPRNPQ